MSSSARDSLINFSFSVDDSALQRFVQVAVADALSKARAEVSAVKKELHEVLSEVMEVKKDLADLKSGTIEKIIGVVEDVVSIMMTSPAGRTGLRKLYFVRKEKEMMRQRKMNVGSDGPPALPFPHLDDLERAGPVESEDEGGVDLDEERLKGLETSLLAAKQTLVNLTEQVIPTRDKVLDKWMSGSTLSYKRLLEFLGLDYLGSTESIAQKSETESSLYLRSVTDSIAEQSRRFSSVETTMKLKIDRSELEAVIFSVRDVRGSADATALRCEQVNNELKALLDDMKRSTNAMLDGKVPWTDLEAFKKGSGEAIKSLREVTIAGQKDLVGLRKDVGGLTMAVTEMEKKLTAVEEIEKKLLAMPAVHPTPQRDGKNGELAPQSKQPKADHLSAEQAAPSSAPGGASQTPRQEAPPGPSSLTPEAAAASPGVEAAEQQAAPDDSSGTSLVKRRVYHATNAAYFNYAEVVPTAGIRVSTTAVEGDAALAAGSAVSLGPSAAGAKRRPQSALLIRK